MWNGFGERTMRLPGTIFVRDKPDNRVTFELRLVYRKPLTNGGCAVVEGGREGSFSGV